MRCAISFLVLIFLQKCSSDKGKTGLVRFFRIFQEAKSKLIKQSGALKKASLHLTPMHAPASSTVLLSGWSLSSDQCQPISGEDEVAKT